MNKINRKNVSNLYETMSHPDFIGDRLSIMDTVCKHEYCTAVARSWKHEYRSLEAIEVMSKQLMESPGVYMNLVIHANIRLKITYRKRPFALLERGPEYAKYVGAILWTSEAESARILEKGALETANRLGFEGSRG